MLAYPPDDAMRNTRIATRPGRIGRVVRLFMTMAGTHPIRARAARPRSARATASRTRGLAGLYAPLANGGAVNGVRLVSPRR